jgi:hypothetical protein
VQFESEQLTGTELSSVVATLSSLKIDYEQVKKDIAENVHNYHVATFHLLRLQKIRERTPMKVRYWPEYDQVVCNGPLFWQASNAQWHASATDL